MGKKGTKKSKLEFHQTLKGAAAQDLVGELADRLSDRRIELKERMSDISNALDRMDKELVVILETEKQLNELPKDFDDLDV